jgi:hypothetical protein
MMWLKRTALALGLLGAAGAAHASPADTFNCRADGNVADATVGTLKLIAEEKKRDGEYQITEATYQAPGLTVFGYKAMFVGRHRSVSDEHGLVSYYSLILKPIAEVQAGALKTMGLGQCVDYGATACILRQQSGALPAIKIQPSGAGITRVSCEFESSIEW